MKISSHFQKFFFGIVCPQLKQGAIKRFKETGKGMGYKHPYTNETIYFDMRYIADDAIYQFLKLVNPNYPKDDTMITPISTKLIEAKVLTEHIQWIERWAALNGVELPYIIDEWERILVQAGISK